MFSVLNLRNNVFAQGNFFVTDKDDNIIEDDPLTLLINNPNPQQARFEFLYNHLLYKGLGNNYINVKSFSETDPRNIDQAQAFFNLNQDFIDFSNVNNLNKTFLFAPSDLKAFGDLTIKYDFQNTTTPIPVKNLVIYNDLPNGLKNDNLIRGCSRVDALIPALSNIAEGQRSKNLNLKFGGTFVMSNKKTVQGMNTPLLDHEQADIEGKLKDKNIIASKTDLEGFRVANDLDDMIFDELFAGSMVKITNAYGMRRDVMNYFARGSTFENQEKAVVAWIQGDIKFESDVFTSTLSQYFRYAEQGKKVKMTFDHLAEMQLVEKMRAEKMNLKADALNKLITAGIKLPQALDLLGIELNENTRQ